MQKIVNLYIPSLYTRFNASVSPDLTAAFRTYFCFHLFLQALKLPWYFGHGVFSYTQIGLSLFFTVLAFHKKTFKASLIFFLIYKLYWINYTFPLTANHYYVEFLILLLLLIFPNNKRVDGTHDGTAIRLVQFSILSIYFFGGVQKLVLGQWLNGEFLLNLFLRNGMAGLTSTVSALIWKLDSNALVNWGGMARGFQAVPFEISSFAFGIILILSWLTLLTEIGLPLLFLFKKSLKVGIFLIIILQIVIGFSAWETEFMFAALGCIFLFFNKNSIKNYSLLGLAHFSWTILIVYVLGIKVGTL